MAGKIGSEAQRKHPATCVYIDSSALVKLYVPERESDRLDAYLQGRRDLMLSELSITEVISAVARRKRGKALSAKQANEIRDAISFDARSGAFRKQDMSPAIHRKAEGMLLSTESVPLRTLDALHIALALAGAASHIITYDERLAVAAALHGLHIVEI